MIQKLERHALLLERIFENILYAREAAADKWMIMHLSWCFTHSLLLCALPLLLLSLYHITFIYQIHLLDLPFHY